MMIENILPIANAPPLQPTEPLDRARGTLEEPQDADTFSSIMALLLQQVLAIQLPESPTPESLEVSGDAPQEGPQGVPQIMPDNGETSVPVAEEVLGAQSDITVPQPLSAATNWDVSLNPEQNVKPSGNNPSKLSMLLRSPVLNSGTQQVSDYGKSDGTISELNEAPSKELATGVTLDRLPGVLAEALGLTDSKVSDSVFPQIPHAIAALDTSDSLPTKLALHQETQPDFRFAIADPVVPDGNGSLHRHEVLPARPSQGVIAVNWAKYVAAPLRQSFVLHLEPETLGEVRIDVTRVHGDISVKMVTAMSSGKEALAAHINTLQETLLQQGLPVSQITVETGLHAGANAWHGARHQVPVPYPPDFAPSAAAPSAEEIQSLNDSAKNRHTGNLDLYV